GNKADREGGERLQRGIGRVGRIKEDLAEDDRRHRGVQVKVVPLQHGANDCGGGNFPQACLAVIG
ncbi:hypothetical protein, partial [Brucella gallinifaecis]|uniref:hypothetical protein n=1 Tax=Brucella gallinifaecis TaxID=215590 RepID=UPI002361A919